MNCPLCGTREMDEVVKHSVVIDFMVSSGEEDGPLTGPKAMVILMLGYEHMLSSIPDSGTDVLGMKGSHHARHYR